MMLSAKCKYGLKAMIHIARFGSKGPVLIADVAEAENIPKKFLDVILLELKTNGLLSSKKGKGGGYQLACSANKITVADIVRSLDGPLGPVPCVSEDENRRCDDCRDEQTCAIRSIMQEVHDAAAAILESVSVADMCHRAQRSGKAVLMFDI
jgi:Rrf2 family protein